jgi:hypothetical protein
MKYGYHWRMAREAMEIHFFRLGGSDKSDETFNGRFLSTNPYIPQNFSVDLIAQLPCPS